MDINDSRWSGTDATNNQPSPNGWPEGMFPSGVHDSARMMMGAIRRWYNRARPRIAAGGTANALTLTYAVVPISLVRGDPYSFVAPSTNTGPATLDVGVGGPLAIQRNNAALTGGEILANCITSVSYDG